MSITLNVTGMNCGHCVTTITKGLNEISGISKVDVSLEKAEVIVDADSSVSAEKIITALDELGFDAQVK